MEEKVITKTTVNGETYKFKDEDAARSGELSEEIVNREAADSQLSAELGQKQDTLTETQLAAVNSGIDTAKVTQISTNTASISDLDAELDGVTEKIPEQASAENQLADKSFVNSSVQTATANFRGNWANFAAVPTDANLYPVDYAGQKTPTTNDYLVVQDASDFPVAQGEPALEGTWRFKYSGDWTTTGKNGWHPEYQVNETPLTSDQLAALNSGITQQAVEKLADIPADAEANTIDSISVNGTAVTPDADKNVALTIPGETIKKLTEADYNYRPSGTGDNNSVAAWKLPSGMYYHDGSITVYGGIDTRGNTKHQVGANTLIQVVARNSYANVYFYSPAESNGRNLLWYALMSVNGTAGIILQQQSNLIDNPDFYNASLGFDNIATHHEVYTVAQRIGTLTNLTTTSKTSAVSAINEVNAKAVAFIGTDGTSAGTMGLVPAPATTDAGKVLGADGSWTTVDSGIKTLTTEDYNYPTNNPTSVAVWLLPTGTYLYKGDININTNSAGTIIPNTVISVRNAALNISKNVFMFIVSDSANMDFVSVTYTPTGSISLTRYLSNIANNLTTNTGSTRLFPLSANQGKVLADRIGDLSTLTTTDKTSTVAAINEVNAKASGGGVKELTTADLNFPTDAPTSLGTWALAPGFYTFTNDSQESVYVRGTNTNAIQAVGAGGKISFLVLNTNNPTASTSSLHVRTLAFGEQDGWELTAYTATTDGEPIGGNAQLYAHILSRDDIENSLTSNSTTRALSARQGKVLNDKITALESRVAALEGN